MDIIEYLLDIDDLLAGASVELEDKEFEKLLERLKKMIDTYERVGKLEVSKFI